MKRRHKTNWTKKRPEQAAHNSVDGGVGVGSSSSSSSISTYCLHSDTLSHAMYRTMTTTSTMNPENPSRRKISHNTKDYFIPLFSWRPKSVATIADAIDERTLKIILRVFFFLSFSGTFHTGRRWHAHNTALAASTKKTEKDFMKYLPLKWRRRYLLFCSFALFFFFSVRC